MTVTIAMPVWNAASTIGPTLRSLIMQSYDDWELHLIDDGSTDATLEMATAVNDPRVRVFRDGRHLGLGARLNQAIEQCATPYLARLDSDDVAYPERLERQVAFLDAHPTVSLVASRALIFGNDGRAIGLTPYRGTHAEICRTPYAGFPMPHPTWMGRRSWFRKHRYRPVQPKSEDQDLLLRAHRESEYACLADVLIGYRQDRLSIGKLAAYRWHFARALVEYAWAQGNYRQVVQAPSMQALKSVHDTVLLGLGLDRFARRHRTAPVPSAELRRWASLWTAFTQSPDAPTNIVRPS